MQRLKLIQSNFPSGCENGLQTTADDKKRDLWRVDRRRERERLEEVRSNEVTRILVLQQKNYID